MMIQPPKKYHRGRMFSIAEVAEHLSVSQKTVRRKLECGQLKGERHGTRGPWRISEGALEDYHSAGERQAQAGLALRERAAARRRRDKIRAGQAKH